MNLKPILPGHVLVCPIRPLRRFRDLSPAERVDLFDTVDRVSRMIERTYKASSLNIAIQDGKDAGQSVPHLHVHLIPRAAGDMEDRGGSDAIYNIMEGNEGDLGAWLIKRELDRTERTAKQREIVGVDDEERRPRSDKEMEDEAEFLKTEMAKDIR